MQDTVVGLWLINSDFIQSKDQMKDSEVLERQTSPQPVHTRANRFCGSAFLLFGFISFFGFSCAAILSKLFPPFENQFLSAVQSDRYYCVLVPLTLPVLVAAVYFHWLSMKLFKHA